MANTELRERFLERAGIRFGTRVMLIEDASAARAEWALRPLYVSVGGTGMFKGGIDGYGDCGNWVRVEWDDDRYQHDVPFYFLARAE